MRTLSYCKLAVLFGLLHFANLFPQEVLKSKVDERIELLGIIYRLSGAREYSQGAIKSYNDDTDKYFADFKNHEAVLLAKEYRNNGIGYDAVMSLAIHLDVQGSSISLNDDIYNNLDSRWNKEMLDNFTEKISDFYIKSNFRKFFESHSEIYSRAEEAMNDILVSKMNFSWFDRFYGVKGGDYNIFVSLTNGSSNYGMKIIHKDKNEEICPIIGVDSDNNSNPKFAPANAVYLLVHEISHSYVNPLVNKHKEKFTKSEKVIFPHISKKMQSQAYGNWSTVMYESLVRVATICYANQDTITNMKVKDIINGEIHRGFFWMADLYTLMQEYEENRDKYATLDDFMPRIISFYDTGLFPRIISSSIENNSKVPHTTKELIFTFSKPMDTKRGYGFNYGKGGKDNFPKIEKVEWIDDETIKLTLDLEPGKMYSIQLYLRRYADIEGLPVIENYPLEFISE